MNEKTYTESELKERIIYTLQNTPWKQEIDRGFFRNPEMVTLYEPMADALIEVFKQYASSLSPTPKEECKCTVCERNCRCYCHKPSPSSPTEQLPSIEPLEMTGKLDDTLAAMFSRIKELIEGYNALKEVIERK